MISTKCKKSETTPKEPERLTAKRRQPNHQLFARREYDTANKQKARNGKNIIEKCFGGLETEDLNTIAYNCAKLIVKNSYEKIVSGDFERPSSSDIEQMLNKELKRNFDEDTIVAEIKHNYPTWSDERVYDEVDKLDDMFEDERSIKIESIIKSTVQEYQRLVEEIQKKVKA